MVHRFLYNDDREKEKVLIEEEISESFQIEAPKEERCSDGTWIQREQLEVRHMSFVRWKAFDVGMPTTK